MNNFKFYNQKETNQKKKINQRVKEWEGGWGWL